jgi:hypothetical protein
VKQQIDLGRSSSAVIGAHFNMVATALIYGATVDPEPLSKAVAGVAAWGAKKTGDAVGQLVLQDAQNRARATLAQGLKDSGLSATDLRTMTPDELRSRVGDFQIGGAKLRDLLQDVPGALPLLEAQSVDLATNLGVEASARTEGIGSDVSVMKADLAKVTSELADYQKTVTTHLDRLDAGLNQLKQSVGESQVKMEALSAAVQDTTVSIRSLAAISYAGWTTGQKLQAVQSGLFPDLGESEKEAVLKSLQAQQSVETAVSEVQSAAQDFGNLAQIASHVGLPPDVVTGLQGAQVAAASIAKFATGDYLGAVAGLTSLVGLGAPDAQAQYYAATMQYLHQAFAEVNAKLDKIIDLQVNTSKVISQLAEFENNFRTEVLGQLDRIESIVIGNREILQDIILNRWEDCHELIYGTAFNGQFLIPDQSILVAILEDRNL